MICQISGFEKCQDYRINLYDIRSGTLIAYPDSNHPELHDTKHHSEMMESCNLCIPHECFCSSQIVGRILGFYHPEIIIE